MWSLKVLFASSNFKSLSSFLSSCEKIDKNGSSDAITVTKVIAGSRVLRRIEYSKIFQIQTLAPVAAQSTFYQVSLIFRNYPLKLPLFATIQCFYWHILLVVEQLLISKIARLTYFAPTLDHKLYNLSVGILKVLVLETVLSKSTNFCRQKSTKSTKNLNKAMNGILLFFETTKLWAIFFI